MPQLTTDWGKNIDREHVLQEYPRPQMRRDSYFNLNGQWHFTVDQEKEAEKKDTLY